MYISDGKRSVRNYDVTDSRCSIDRCLTSKTTAGHPSKIVHQKFDTLDLKSASLNPVGIQLDAAELEPLKREKMWTAEDRF